MATVPVESKLSYSKVVSGGKENTPLTFARVAAAANASRTVDAAKQSASKPRSIRDEAHAQNNRMESPYRDAVNEPSLIDAVNAITIGGSTPSLVVNGSGDINLSSQGASADSSPDDLFQRTDSGSDMGTKPPSIDGKSIASGTTYALDEKESLRPDDSASVKAAEDDDTFSGRGSIVAGSRIGSEAAARAYRAQTYDIADRRAMVQNMEPQGQGILTPQSSSSGQQVVDGAILKPLSDPARPEEGFNLFYKHGPDEKLLEALDSPKDRMFLLRLEQDLISFVKDSKEPFIDLPPCNSFCRLLTHKLADYYHMTHQFDSGTGSVRIFRTPFCRLPETLTSISNPPTSAHTPPIPVPTMKIMRRGGEGDTGGSPSKTTSEVGSDGKEKLSAKEKLSREEREAAYNKARERIFGNSDSKAGDATPDTEDGNNMSRSSSVSAKDRSGQGRRKPGKQRRDDSESFDVRSQYTPFFPQQQQPAWGPMPQYNPIGVPQFGNTMQPPYQGTASPPFVQTQHQYHPGMMPAIGGQPYNQMAQTQIQQVHMPLNQMMPHQMMQSQMPQPPMPPMPPNQMMHSQMPQQFIGRTPTNYQPHSAPITAYGSPTQTPPQQPGQWLQTAYQSPYQQPRGPTHGMPTIPYPYGQLPSTANPADPKSQHPIPGSFNRHAFNPKTQSFVPGNNGMQPQQSMSHHGSPHLPYNAFPSPQQFNNGLGYNMSRQGSNTSLPSYHASPHIATTRPMMHQGMPSSGPNGSHLPHFGNASTLPPKPPPTA